MTNIRRTIPPPDLTAVLEAAKRDSALSMNCVKIGTIQEFNSTDQTATISVSFKQVISVGDDGARVVKEYPLLLQCPVFTLFGGNNIITAGVAAGDNCIILFCDRQIDEWLNFGDGRAPVSRRVHDLSDGIALVGIRPLTNSIQGYLTNGIRLAHGDSSRMDLKDDLIETIAEIFEHTGDMEIDGNVTISGNLSLEGTVFGNGGVLTLDADLQQEAGHSIHAGNGANGTFTTVTVVDGIVVSGT